MGNVGDVPGAERARALASARMKEFLRLISYARRYVAQLVAAVVLMTAAGAATGMHGHVGGAHPLQALEPARQRNLSNSYIDPIFPPTLFYLSISSRPGSTTVGHLAYMVLRVLPEGFLRLFRHYLVNYVGFSAITNLPTRCRQGSQAGGEFFRSPLHRPNSCRPSEQRRQSATATSHIPGRISCRQLFMAVALEPGGVGEDFKLAFISAWWWCRSSSYLLRRSAGVFRRTTRHTSPNRAT